MAGPAAEQRREALLLYAEDDHEDRALATMTLEREGLRNVLRFVRDGEELLDYLHARGPFSGERALPRPDAIILDLQMPRKSGREALAEMRSCEELAAIPVVVLVHWDPSEASVPGATMLANKPFSFRELFSTLAGFAVGEDRIVVL